MDESGRTATDIGPVRPRLFYATPTGKNPKLAYVLSSQAIRMTVRDFRHEFDDAVMNAGPVQMARTDIVEKFLSPQFTCTSAKCRRRKLHEPDLQLGKCPACKEPVEGWQYDYLLMHDDDLGVAPVVNGVNAVDLLLRAFKENEGIGIASLVYLREQPPITVLTLEHPEHKGEAINVSAGFPNAVFDVWGAGTGFMLVSRECIEAIKDVDDREYPGGRPMFAFWPVVNKWGMQGVVGEDYDFCLRAHRAGFRVVVDARIPTSHVKDNGPLNYDWASWNADDRIHQISGRGIEGAVVKVVDGIQCIDVTPRRAKDAEQMRATRAAGA